MERGFRLPSEPFFYFCVVTYEDFLVSGALITIPFFEREIVALLENIKKLNERNRVLLPPARIECVSPCVIYVLNSSLIELREVFNIENIPDLLAIPIERYRTLQERCYRKPREPSLVFNAKLVRSVNTRLAKHNGRNPVNSRIITHVFVRRALAAPIRGMKIKLLPFVDTTRKIFQMISRFLFFDLQLFKVSVYFVC